MVDYAASFRARLPDTPWFTGQRRLVDKLSAYLPPEEVELVVRAYEFGAAAHEGQRRRSGEPYISHPVAVADILADLHIDGEGIAAAILHDVIEDTPAVKDELAEKFGNDVAELVDGVTKLDQVQFRSRAEAQAESFRKMLLAMVEDIRVILVKLADRLHNMRTLESMPAEKQRRIARETLEIYAPIANRLGIHTMKTELEELGFRYLYPHRYRVLEKAVRRSFGNQRQMLKKISLALENGLRDVGIEGEVDGREKNLYSIYTKMRRKKKSLAEVVDVYGFRVIVPNVEACYRALGLVHKLYKPMPRRFKDYIAIPRVNGYQSLHTICFGPRGLPLEVQIRTREMDMMAEQGIASHWRYKAHDKSSPAPQVRAREWLAQLVEIEERGSSEEFMEHVKVDLYPDKVYVFTPKGDIFRLPRGATVVDFAYAIHTDIGNRCVAAKIDRRLVPLRTPLANGQTVQVITARGARPNPNWVNFVATAKARSAVRLYLRQLQTSEAIDLGRRLLDQALRDLGSSLRRISRNRLKQLLDDLGLNVREELYEQVGLGERLAPIVARLVINEPPTKETATAGTDAPLTISGTEGMVVSFGRCCYPIPGDAIMGYLSSGRGIVIHREDCRNLETFRKHPQKWITVDWRKDTDEEFLCRIVVEAENRMGILAEVAASISATETNIEQVDVNERDQGISSITFYLHVRDHEHLASVTAAVRKMPRVKRVYRYLFALEDDDDD
ncbi:MAG: bifunctional (p)ppGpp synthetase/guanosine-3',5'-bis(diphosphate) 3'-pyrophosphohydrolase [Pseudomonadota bacterium]